MVSSSYEQWRRPIAGGKGTGYHGRESCSFSWHVAFVSHLYRFNLTVLNEFTCKPASLLHIDAIVINSCIDITSSRQVIRD